MENSLENEPIIAPPSGVPRTARQKWYHHKKLVVFVAIVFLLAVILVSSAYLSCSDRSGNTLPAADTLTPTDKAETPTDGAPNSTLEQTAGWIEPQPLPDLGLFASYSLEENEGGPGFETFVSRYYLVGRVKAGKYADNEIITAVFGKNGAYYTLLRKDGSYVAASRYQSDFADAEDLASTIASDQEFILPELDFPDRIEFPAAGLSFIEPNLAMRLDPNTDAEALGQELFTDPLWGKIYDYSQGSDARTQIALALPNGLSVYYSLEENSDGQTPLGGGRTLSDYTLSGSCGHAWTRADHGAYYETANLRPVGTWHGGSISALDNAELLKKLYTEMDGGISDPYYPGIKDVSWEKFSADQPLLVWTDPFGRQLSLMNRKYAECLGGMGKPAVYLYPTKEQEVSVSVATPGPMTVSIPDYGQGWKVSARPDGRLTDLVSGKEYPYLFWESEGGSGYARPQAGFNVARNDLHAFFESTLARYGLNQKERSDFEEFWEPRLEKKNSPYYFLTFTTTEKLQNYAPLEITPQPDTLIRIFLDYELLPAPKNAAAPEIITPKRSGFTAVEWGGALK